MNYLFLKKNRRIKHVSSLDQFVYQIKYKKGNFKMKSNDLIKEWASKHIEIDRFSQSVILLY